MSDLSGRVSPQVDAYGASGCEGNSTNVTPSERHYGPFLSLGAGVQSTALLLLSAQGVLPKLVAAIFADTGNEPQAVYDHLDRIEEEVAKPAGIPILRVQWGDIRNDAVTGHRWLKIPVFVLGADGKKGQGTRQCTKDYKVDPIKRKLKTLLGSKTSASGAILQPPPGVVAEQWIGISLDEVHRAKDADERWLRNSFPLLDMRWTRDDCLNYLEEQGWASTPKSACVICPFHSNRMWREIKEQAPEEFADAVEFDRQLRSGEMRHGFEDRAFLHTDRVPLDQADLRSPAEKAAARGEVGLWEEEPEQGGCSPFSCPSDLPQQAHDEGDAA